MISYKTGIKKWFAFVTVLVFILAFCTILKAENLSLTEKERVWLNSHPKVIFSVPTKAPPLYYLDDQGKFAGINIDYMRLLAKRIGIDIEFKGHATWKGAIEDAKNHIVDGIPNADATEDRKFFLNFTNVYSIFPQVLVTRGDYDLIRRFKDVSGKRIAVKGSSSRVYLLKDQYPESEIVEVGHIEEGLDLLVVNKVDALYADLAQVDALLTDKFYTNLKYAVVAETPPVGQARIGLRNDDPMLLQIFNKSIASISREEHHVIKERWLPIGKPALERKIELTAKERAWLKEHPVIRVGADPDWGPIEFLGDDGRYQGFSIDLLNQIALSLEVRFEFVGENWQELIARAKQGQLDLFSCMAKTPVRDEYLLFTEPYIQMAAGLFAKEGVAYISDLNSIINQQVAVVEGYAIHDYLVYEFPDLKLLLVKNPEQGIHAVLDGDAFAYIDNVITTGHLISQKGYMQINMVGEVPFKFAQRMAIRKDWPILRNILQKAINNIPTAERTSLYNQWVPLVYEKPADYSLFWKIGAVCLIFIGLFFFWNRRLVAEVDRRTAELVSNEKRLNAIFNHRFQLTGLLSPDGKLIMANENVCRLVDVAFKEIEGKFLWELPHWSHSEELQRQIRDCVENAQKGNLVRIETTHPDSEGKIHSIDFHLTPVRNENGEIIFIVPEGHDITERKTAETEKEIMQEQLSQSQKMEAIGTLAGGIAHDFNNILSAIFGYSELARNHMKDPERLKRDLDEIFKGAKRARDLVMQILTFSRGTGQEKQPLLMSLVVKEALKLLRSSIPTTIDIKQELVSQAKVLADPTQIHQIIMNLCTNAYHAMRDAGGTLKVTLKDVEISEFSSVPGLDLASGMYLRLEVSDTGVGMDEETKAKIFEPYYTTREKGEGTGLGLAVVHGIVDSHQGHISIHSKPGQGTAFRIYFPIIEGEETVKIFSKMDKPLVGGNETIIIVDDEESILNLESEVLTKYGYTVASFTNGVQALQEFQKKPDYYDLVISDMTMPYMTGTELAKKVMEIRPDMPIILCTGHSELINREKAMAMGIKDYYEKPVNMGHMLRIIRTVLDGED